MSNRAKLQTTKFENIPSGEVTWGYRLWDDEEQVYSDCWDSVPADDLEFLAAVIEEGSSILDWVQENHNGMYINGSWYDWDEIKHVFQDDPSND